MGTYQKIAGTILIFLGICCLIILTILHIGFSIVQIFEHRDFDEISRFVKLDELESFLRIVFIGIVILVPVPSIIAGIGLINQKSWARKLGIVMSVCFVFFFPVGTVLGMISIVLIASEEKTLNDQQSLGSAENS